MREQEIDAKAKAAVYREVADLIDLADALPSDSDLTPSDYIRKKANRLDPPQPEIPDGTIVEVSLDDGTKMIGYKYGTSLKRCSDGTGAITKVNGKCIRPVRTVEPGSVVLSLAEAEQILPALPLTSPISRIVCGAIARTKQEAER